MACFRVVVVALLLCFSFQAIGGELPRVKPEEVGLSGAKMAGLKPALQKLVDEGKIPGGVAITLRHGKVADITTFGCRDLQAKTLMHRAFTILESKGETFKARIVDAGFDREVAGTIKDGKISGLAKGVQASRGGK